MERKQLKRLTRERVLDAKALLDANRWSAAYYVAGYAVELALKVCILKRLKSNPGILFEEKRFSERCWTHNIEQLLKAANLTDERDDDAANNVTLRDNWLTVKDWTEETRYNISGESRARRLYEAITDQINGVLPWVKARW